MRLGYEAILLKTILFGCHVTDQVLREKALLGSHENMSIHPEVFGLGMVTASVMHAYLIPEKTTGSFYATVICVSIEGSIQRMKMCKSWEMKQEKKYEFKPQGPTIMLIMPFIIVILH